MSTSGYRLDKDGLSHLWRRLKEKFAFKLHTHNSEDISDLSDKLSDYVLSKDLPTKTSQLVNDSGFVTTEESSLPLPDDYEPMFYVTENYVTDKISELENVYAKKDDVIQLQQGFGISIVDGVISLSLPDAEGVEF